jgi:hypothetical protein
MNRRWIYFLFAPFLLLISATSIAQQQCSDCDCYHIVSKECENCCGFASGNVVSVTNSSVAITEKESTSDAVSVKKTFALTPHTKKNAALKEGAPVTVYYRKEGNVATRVDRVDALSGLLVPADEPDPPLPSSCSRLHPVPVEALRIYLGGNAGYAISDEITVLNLKGTDVLGLRRTSNRLAINAKTFSEDGKIIVEIVDSRFYVNPNNSFRMDKPDNHEIAVYDLQDRKVLDVRYMNSHSVRILGIFQVQGAPPFIVDENEITFGGFHASGSCFSGRTLFKYG